MRHVTLKEILYNLGEAMLAESTALREGEIDQDSKRMLEMALAYKALTEAK